MKVAAIVISTILLVILCADSSAAMETCSQLPPKGCPSGTYCVLSSPLWGACLTQMGEGYKCKSTKECTQDLKCTEGKCTKV